MTLSKARLQACEERVLFAEFGLRSCNLSTASPGARRVDFFVTDSLSGARVSAVRTVWIVAPCPAGEVRCADRSCSRGGGLCLPGELAVRAAARPPSIHLLAPPRQPAGSGGVVRVPAGTAYEACSSVASVVALCEPGKPHRLERAW